MLFNSEFEKFSEHKTVDPRVSIINCVNKIVEDVNNNKSFISIKEKDKKMYSSLNDGFEEDDGSSYLHFKFGEDQGFFVLRQIGDFFILGIQHGCTEETLYCSEEGPDFYYNILIDYGSFKKDVSYSNALDPEIVGPKFQKIFAVFDNIFTELGLEQIAESCNTPSKLN